LPVKEKACISAGLSTQAPLSGQSCKQGFLTV
jgi:hypothetical protein